MVQLILDIDNTPLSLPESRGYLVAETALATELEMISGRMVRELRGLIYTVSYQYGLLTGDEKDRFLSICEKGWRSPITCDFLTPDVDALTRSRFLVTEFTFPRFLQQAGTTPLWGDFRVELREVRPHA